MTGREWETVGAWVMVWLCALTLVSYYLIEAIAWLEERDRRRAAADATVFDEPTRAEVETGWLDEATEEWLFTAPEFVGSEAADFDVWEQEVAS